MSDAFQSKRFRVTAPEMGATEVFLNSQKLRWYAECSTDRERHDFIAHEAWCNLFQHRDTKRILEGLCNKMGTTKVKNTFTAKIQIEELV